MTDMGLLSYTYYIPYGRSQYTGAVAARLPLALNKCNVMALCYRDTRLVPLIFVSPDRHHDTHNNIARK